jgi:hypothetical protein
MLDTIIGIVSFGYSIVAGIKQGRQLAELQRSVELCGQRFERVSPGALYLPDKKIVTDTSKKVQDVVRDEKTVKGAVEKMLAATQSPIAVSQMILTPEKTTKLLASNPWDVLLNVHPHHKKNPETPKGLVAVMFEFQGLKLVGYQSVGALRFMLGIDVSRDHEFWLPPSSTSSDHISRNTRCPCGSGDRFKHCCGRLA